MWVFLKRTIVYVTINIYYSPWNLCSHNQVARTSPVWAIRMGYYWALRDWSLLFANLGDVTRVQLLSGLNSIVWDIWEWSWFAQIGWQHRVSCLMGSCLLKGGHLWQSAQDIPQYPTTPTTATKCNKTQQHSTALLTLLGLATSDAAVFRWYSFLVNPTLFFPSPTPPIPPTTKGLEWPPPGGLVLKV